MSKVYKLFAELFEEIEETAEQIKVARWLDEAKAAAEQIKATAAEAKAAALDVAKARRDRLVNEDQDKTLAAIQTDRQGGGRLRRYRSRKKNTRRRMRRKRSRRCRR